jgi:hypothetical protein
LELKSPGHHYRRISSIDTGVLIGFDCFLPHLITIDHTSLLKRNFSFKNAVMRGAETVAGAPRRL